MPITIAGRDLASASFFDIFAKIKFFTLARLPGGGGWPRPEVVIAPALYGDLHHNLTLFGQNGPGAREGCTFSKR